MKPKIMLAISAILLGFNQHSGVAADGDAVQGEAVFKKCMACHRVGEDAKNAVGPVLNGVFGRQAGVYPGYKYSTLNQTAGENGLIWTEETVFEYLPDPQGFLVNFLEKQGKGDLVKGRTKMPFKLPNEKDRLDVIAYLKQFSAEPSQ